MRFVAAMLVCCSFAVPAIAAGVGRVSDPGTAPSETLPPNEALRALEKTEADQRRQSEVAYIQSQRGKAFFAYVPMPAVDGDGKAVVDPKTHRQMMDGFCIVWRPDWVTDNPHLSVVDGHWYTGFSFKVDPGSGKLLVYEVTVPNGANVSGGYRAGGEPVTLAVHALAKLAAQPDPAWPCRTETWVTVLTAPERYLAPASPWGVAAGSSNSYKQYRERERQNCIASPQIYHGNCGAAP